MLLEAFADNSASPVAPDLAKMNAEARAARDAIYEKQFPGSSGRSRRRQKSAGRVQAREVLYPDRLGLDPYVMKAAFGWLDVRAARTSNERLTWLDFVREILGIVLQSVPTVATPSTQEIDGLPSDFDDWAFKSVARTFPYLTPAEHPEELWQPILDRARLPINGWSAFFGTGSPTDLRHRHRRETSFGYGAL